jgi:hypothetical protein
VLDLKKIRDSTISGIYFILSRFTKIKEQKKRGNLNLLPVALSCPHPHLGYATRLIEYFNFFISVREYFQKKRRDSNYAASYTRLH